MIRTPCSRSSIGFLAMGQRSTMRDANARPQMDDIGKAYSGRLQGYTPFAHSRESGNPGTGSPPSRGRADARPNSTQPALLRLLEITEEMQIVGCDRGLDWRARRETQIRIDARDP